ncbi:MAG TPA: pilus assembly PilX N-terminal domain-containing protein [Candidatus Eremiobacteraeota bacterium]|nr:MAG: hypothetical protein BWY64_03646 [bacterium ADurb.Bin363]HPZ08756.1 pilus assembly PilX N-terminal domain-containing protein [Candidatus Eremiobacteraeota bacterium]
MKNINKKITEKGIALITVLALSLILCALGVVLIREAYHHMANASAFSQRIDAINIAEYGVHKAIYELEHDLNWDGMIDAPFRNGKVTVEVLNNFQNFEPNGVIPSNSILVRSTGELSNGNCRKSVEAILSYQLIPYAAFTDGRVELSGNNIDLELKSLPGFKGQMHSNYDSTVTGYDISKPYAFSESDPPFTLNLNLSSEALVSTTGSVQPSLQGNIISAGGMVREGTSLKRIPTLAYSDIKAVSGSHIDITQNIPAKVDIVDPFPLSNVEAKFKGNLRNKEGTLQAYCHYVVKFGPYIIKEDDGWFEAEQYLPDGTSWDKGSIVIQSGVNYYYDGTLTLENINVSLANGIKPALFIDGNLDVTSMNLHAESFLLATAGSTSFNNVTFQIDNSKNDGVSCFCGGNLTVTTPETYAPSGGNYFKGIAYIKNGAFRVNNQCNVSGFNNSVKMEGLLIVGGNSSGEGIIVNNSGDPSFKISFIYNPHLARSLSATCHTDIQLQPVFWEVK